MTSSCRKWRNWSLKASPPRCKGKISSPRIKRMALCLAAAVFEMNMLRRELIKPGLPEKFLPLCKISIPVTENLFGDELSKSIKDIDEMNKITGKMARQHRYAPYGIRGRGRGNNQQHFLARGGSQPTRPTRPYRGNLSARRGRGRGAGRGQPQQ